jgi:hypothetical protein
MATNFAQTPPDPEDMQDGGADEASEQDQSQGGYCIEIHVSADGSLSVGVEPESEEYDEGQGAPDKGTPAKNIKDALTQALEIYKSNGQAPEGGSDAEFDSGFKSRGSAY